MLELSSALQPSRLAAEPTALSAELAFLFLGIAIGPGMAEELLFRGLLQRAVQRRFGVSAGVIVSSCMFSALHMDLAQSLATLVLGLYLALVALATASIRAGIAVHILNNGVAVVGAAYFASSSQAPLWLNLLAGAAICIGLRILLRELRPAATPTTYSEPP